MCLPSTKAKVTESRGYLAGVVTLNDEQGCGSARCPWEIQVQAGQNINLTLYDFDDHRQGHGGFYYPESCFRYGVIKEKAAQRDTPLCANGERRKIVYTSLTNSIQIHVVSQEVLANRGHFLLYYEGLYTC